MDEQIEFSIMKVAYSGLTKENMPERLQFVLKAPTRVLRKNSLTIVAKNITLQLLLFIEEAKEIFEKLNKQYQTRNTCIVVLQFPGKVKKIHIQQKFCKNT